MTKDGRPSLINDIRLFVGTSSTSSSYLKGFEEAAAYGRRIAWLLNSEGFSLGAFPALYVLFTATQVAGFVSQPIKGGEWWHRYVQVGVTANFPNDPDASDVIKNSILAALLAIRPDQERVIRQADAAVRDHRDQLRFLLKRRDLAKLTVEVSFNIAAWPKPSHLFIAHTDKTTGIYREADPIALGFYDEGFDLVGGIRIQDAANLKEVQHRPVMLEIVKRRG